MKNAVDCRYCCLRLPRLSYTLYEKLSHATDQFESLYQSDEFEEFRKILQEENPSFFELTQLKSIPRKIKISILNYLMRCTTRFSPYKNMANSVALNFGDTTNYLEGDIQFIHEKSEKPKGEEIQRENPLSIAKAADYKIYAGKYQANIIKASQFEKLQKESEKTIHFNPYDYSENPHRSGYAIQLSQNQISKSDLEKVAKAILPLRFINGNHVNKSIQLIENIRAELYDFQSSLPIPLLEALTGFKSFYTPNVFLSKDVNSQFAPLRAAFYNRSMGKEVLELTDKDIEDLTALAPKEHSNFSKDFTLLFSPLGREKFVEYFRFSYKGIRPLSEEFSRDQIDIEIDEVSGELAFFDFVFAGKDPVLNNRPQTTQYCVSVDGTPIPKDLSEIALEDIYVYASQYELVLYSKSLKKRLIPALTTTYLAENDDNPLLRFFAAFSKCAINDGLYVDLSWLKQEYIPRVVYKDLILFPKTWKFELSKLDDIYDSLPERMRLIEGDKSSLVYKSSPYAKDQISKGAGDIIEIQEDLSSSKNSYLYQLGASFKTDLEPRISRLKIYEEKKTLDRFIEIKVSAPAGHIELLGFQLIEKYFQEENFYFIFYPHPEPHIRLRIERVKGLKIFEELIEDKLCEYAKVSLAPFNEEVGTYGGSDGLGIYLDASMMLSSYFVNLKKNSLLLGEHRLSSGGNVVDVIYLAKFAVKLLGESSLEVGQTSLESEISYKEEKRLFEFYQKLANHPILLRIDSIVSKIDQDMMEYIGAWDNFVKREKISKPDNYFQLRLIHMEMFRHIPLPSSDLNKLILRLANRIYRNEIAKR